MGQKVTFRTREQVSRFFAGLELAEPGVVPIQDWRADSILDFNSAPTAMWGGVRGSSADPPLRFRANRIRDPGHGMNADG